ncbi:MAG: DUF61 family protein [Candidatus Caldarchaeum sp.]|nr:DUF61 family protein [Candidatus Caldarchaeum sp.]
MSFVDEWLSQTLKRINDVLPKKPERIGKLLEMETPFVETVGGDRHYFDKAELLAVQKVLPHEVLENLYLPIVFSKNLSFGDHVYVIKARGTEPEAFRILMELRELPKADNVYYTYKPLVAEFLNKYPTLGVVGYI